MSRPESLVGECCDCCLSDLCLLRGFIFLQLVAACSWGFLAGACHAPPIRPLHRNRGAVTTVILQMMRSLSLTAMFLWLLMGTEHRRQMLLPSCWKTLQGRMSPWNASTLNLSTLRAPDLPLNFLQDTMTSWKTLPVQPCVNCVSGPGTAPLPQLSGSTHIAGKIHGTEEKPRPAGPWRFVHLCLHSAG